MCAVSFGKHPIWQSNKLRPPIHLDHNQIRSDIEGLVSDGTSDMHHDSDSEISVEILGRASFSHLGNSQGIHLDQHMQDWSEFPGSLSHSMTLSVLFMLMGDLFHAQISSKVLQRRLNKK